METQIFVFGLSGTETIGNTHIQTTTTMRERDTHAYKYERDTHTQKERMDTLSV
jgi:hypothetical protein